MSAETPIKVIVADDHNLIRQSIAEMLQRGGDIEVVGQAADGAEAISLTGELSPDVVLLDIEMPVMSAQEAIEQISRVSPASRVVILTMYDEPRLMRDFLARGASGYLVKTISREELISSVKSQARGEDRVVLSLSREAIQGSTVEGAKEVISDRELEILLYAARGMSNAQIGSYLHLTEGTVKRHLHSIYTKLNVASRGEATRKALSEGWITAKDITRLDDTR